MPFLCLQPLVENAVRHGLEGKAGRRHDHDRGRATPARECVITVEDDGVGDGPGAGTARARRRRRAPTRVGLGNVDERLRSAFGDDFGLVVETAPGAGTKVTVRVPKFAPEVHA